MLPAMAQPKVGTVSVLPRVGVALANLPGDKMYIAGGVGDNMTYSARYKAGLMAGVDIDWQFMPNLSATCIGCGACVAACKNGSAMLFVSAKVSQFALLPQGKVEAARRVRAMVSKMDELGFGNCTNTGACAAQCPKNISLSNIARMNREYMKMKIKD